MGEKATERDALGLLKDEIDRAAREHDERERLKKLAPKPPRARPKPEPDHDQKLGLAAQLQAGISVATRKIREREDKERARREAVAPTPERLAKSGENSIERRDTRAHVSVAPVDRYGKHWPAEIERAARDIRNIFLIDATGAQRVTGAYDGMPNNPGGARPGGVQDYIREMCAMADLIRAKFPGAIRLIDAFLVEVVLDQTGKHVDFADMARSWSPWNDQRVNRGVGYGMFVQMLRDIGPFLEQERAKGWGWAGARSGDTAVRAINVELKARAQIMREQAFRREQEEQRRAITKGGK